MKTDLIPSLEETLFLPSGNCADTLLELAEIGLDSDLADGIIKEIPILRSIADLCKTGLTIHNKIHFVQSSRFLEA